VQAVVDVAPDGVRPTLHVLAVGVTNYRDGALRAGVRFAADDARAVAAALSDQRRAVADQVAEPVVLIDEEATRQRIVTELRAMAARVKPSDLFVLHLAGHGVSLEDGDYHFLPVDVIYRNEEDLRRLGLSGPELNDLLRSIKANKTVVLLDTCSSGAFNLSGRSLGDKGSISRFARLNGRVVLAAAGDKAMALESEDNQRGIFSGALISGITTGKANSNRNETIEISELADFVEAEVVRITRKLFQYEQFPMRIIHGRNFPVARTGTGASPGAAE
jgi:uncharacterized caspase-like protein